MASSPILNGTALVTLLAACAAQPHAPSTASPAADGAGAGRATCEAFADRMCEHLDSRSEACIAVRRVAVWLAPSACMAASRDIEQSVAEIASLREDCTEVERKLCAKVDGDPALCEPLAADLRTVAPEDCAELLEVYPKVEQAFLTKVKRNAPLSAQQRADLVAGEPPSWGPKDGKVMIGVFSDFECPYCAMARATIDRIKEDYPEQVGIVFRQFPLPFHPHARHAALAGVAAHAQGKFWALHDAMFEHQDALSEDDVLQYAKQVGLDEKAFLAALAAETTAKAVADDVELGRALFVEGTPTVFLNGRRVENPLDYEAVRGLIDRVLAGEAATAPAGAEEAE